MAYTEAKAAASVGVYQPVVMPPTMMRGVRRAGKDSLKSLPTSPGAAFSYLGKFFLSPMICTMSIITSPTRIPGTIPPMKRAATEALVRPE